MSFITLFRNRRALSLTWRVIALSSLLLLVLVSLFTWLGHTNLTRQFQDSRQQHHARQQREVRLALQRSEEGLRQLTSLAAAAPELGPAMEANDADAVRASLASQWPTLQLDSGIDEIQVFDRRGDPLASWGQSQASSQPVRSWVRRVLSTEMPLTTLRCSTGCRQYAAVPVLVDGTSVGLVILSRSLADVIRQAKSVSGSEIALLVTGAEEDEIPPSARRLPAWHGQLLALTQEELGLPLLLRAAEHTSLEGLTDAPLALQHGDRLEELSAIRVEENQDRQSTGYFLLISDITAQVQSINHDTRTLLVAGVAGWLAAELLLLVILLGPMARLRRVAGVLPALARGGFAEARRAIPASTRRWPDEIDVLEGTTIELSRQLEVLEEEIQARGEQLAERVDELAKERDFVGGLLDTARVFIIAQDGTGRINLVNAYALTVLKVEEKTLIGRRFDDIFTLPGQSPVADARTAEQEERTLLTPEGQVYTIAWYHAPLPGGGDTGLAWISVGLDITERKAAEGRLTWLAERDPLTELYNRRYFQEAIQLTLQRGRQGALLLLDLDQFKEVNELSGHHAGDKLLREVADVLRLHIGHRGHIARLGGDEFAILLEQVDADQAIGIAQQCNQLLEGLHFRAGGRRHRVVASIGIAQYPIHGDNPADLLASADVAMYKAKEHGPQRWHLLSTLESAKNELQERVYWGERLRKALQEEGFALMVQPIVRLADQDVKHYEVLIRMREEDGRLASPAHFIPVAERNGMIVQLDRWVLHHSLKALRRVQEQGISLAVNLSGQSLHDKGLEQFLADELASSGADPHHLILEITETAAITDFSTARGVLQSMRDLGCRTALDDFGVGFSSFHYLGQLPVDYIKIDGSFIRSLALSADNRVIVKAIADIAAGFGKQAIAEFVDSDKVIPLLNAYGIAYGQGFHLGKPQPLDVIFDAEP
ncbi:bifunctional diguanylate cyclase/phosphodiesterase [Halomonas organivorans]|uniref:Diguanylate cyclase (GGDEF)-like protein n=1 Tax=Halomonas organivorans TaxID=257772 RepID=A0A7W5BUU3_9GAMM|nr:EAL domain-containing protein [Halomonas organivorans]MBB3139426.1 diguanylate cyclase (GGDEF)-like protein [Halomonas organivorans]